MVTIHVGLLLFTIGWMLTVTATQAVVAWQVKRIVDNHLPHLENKIELLQEQLNDMYRKIQRGSNA